MVLLETDICEFGLPAAPFSLKSTDRQLYGIEECRGENGLLVMFICNHCPYVKAILGRIVRDTRELENLGIGSVAIMSNDPSDYAEDSFDNMIRVAREQEFGFPYLLDSTQQVARTYGAVCTPDFFGYNADLELQYRGRLDSSGARPAPDDAPRELFEAMKLVAETGKGPRNQVASMGCSIKWMTE